MRALELEGRALKVSRASNNATALAVNAPPLRPADKRRAVPWLELLAAPALWGMYVGNVAVNWTWYTLLTFLPEVRHGHILCKIKTVGRWIEI